jgi:hypothetical protein
LVTEAGLFTRSVSEAHPFSVGWLSTIPIPTAVEIKCAAVTRHDIIDRRSGTRGRNRPPSVTSRAPLKLTEYAMKDLLRCSSERGGGNEIDILVELNYYQADFILTELAGKEQK